MRSASIKKNFTYNVILTMSTYIFGLIVFPYVSRVLGVDMIGRVNFADQTINYLHVLAAMGIGTVGVREIAACGDDRRKRSQVFSDMFSFILVLALVSVFILLVMIFTVPQFTEIKRLLFVGSFYLFFASVSIEWFYQGMEEFRFVAIRSILVRLIYVVLVFLLVKSPGDFLLYYVLITGTIVANALINLAYSRKFVDLTLLKSHPGRYAKSIFALGIYMVMLSFFSTFNVVYLGMVKGEHDVGVYTTATKIYTLILGVLSAYTTVMMPRMTSLLSENRIEDFKSRIAGSFKLVFSVAFPLIAGGIVLAPQIIGILAGDQYWEAVPVMRLIMPLVLVVGLAQIWVIQVLLPMKKDNVVLWSAVLSAAVGVILNVTLVGKYSYLGSAIAMLGAELVNDSVTMVYALKKGYLKFPVRRMLGYIIAAIPYVIICFFCSFLFKNIFLALGTAMALCLSWFVVAVKICR